LHSHQALLLTHVCLDAIVQSLDVGEMPKEERVIRPTIQAIDGQLISRMAVLREEIKARRGGKLITTDFLEQVRAERDKELNQTVSGLDRLRHG